MYILLKAVQVMHTSSSLCTLSTAGDTSDEKEWANDYAKSDLHFLLSCLLYHCSNCQTSAFGKSSEAYTDLCDYASQPPAKQPKTGVDSKKGGCC